MISVIIPTYNRINYLKELVASIPLLPEIEIVISQDRFPTGLYNEEIFEFGKDLATAHGQIQYHLTSSNKGLAGNWNEAVNLANGEYCIIVGDDDRFCRNALQRFIELVDQTQADVIFSNHLLIDGEGKVLESSYDNSTYFNRGDLAMGFLPDAEQKIWQNAIPISASLVKTELLKKELFRENINTPEIEFFLRVWNKYNCAFYFTPEYLVEYRVHQLSATKAGLTVHRLFHWLEEIKVSPKNEVYKKDLLSSLASSSVNLLLQEHQYAAAKKIISSPYFPNKTSFNPKYWVQQILCNVPLLSKLYFKLAK